MRLIPPLSKTVSKIMSKTMSKTGAQETVWRVRLTTSTKAAPRYAEALEDFCPTVSWIDTDEDGVVEVEGISEEKLDQKAIRAALKASSSEAVGPIVFEPLPQQDWLQLSFQSFPPKPLGRFWIYGSHETQKPPAGCWPLMIDAATAFGSGEHPTTAGCLAEIERLSKRRKFKNVLDMGTGSGILAIAAVRAMGAHVTAVDIDPESIRVTRNHGAANHLQNFLSLQAGPGYRTPLARQNAPYDLILCNILARPLRIMAKQAVAQLAPGGVIVLAGLLNTQANSVIEAYRTQGLKLLKRTPRQEWTILVMQKAR